MNARLCSILSLVTIALSPAVESNACAEEGRVHFDLPSTAAAVATVGDPNRVTVELPLSSMIDSPRLPKIDQWLVRVIPRDRSIRIRDYAPRTEASSDVATPIQVKSTQERSQSMGLSLNAGYGHLVDGNAIADRGSKQVDSTQFDRVAPVQAVTASGTILRGRGVYFKLRWTASQILEGEKVFRVTMQVPPGWRGGLIDVSVVAETASTSLAPWDRDPKQIGAAQFIVAAYRDGDLHAESLARTVAESEHALRIVAARSVSRRGTSLPSLVRQLAIRLDGDAAAEEMHWIQRLLLDRADPYTDRQIRKLPVETRVAVLDYVDLRNQFAAMNARDTADSTIARQSL